MKRKYACEFNSIERNKIKKRDRGQCIFCSMGYRKSYECAIGELQIMHYIPRSQGGLGTEQNGALGCIYHHQMMDNGLYGNEMRRMFREYLEEHYPNWNEEKLKYDKWKIFSKAKEE